MKFLPVIVYCAGILLFSCANSEPVNKAQPTLPLQILKFGEIELEVEIADSEGERRAGLSYRTELAENRGMLFIYPDSRIRYFTSRNTLIPLSIAFIDKNGIILEIQKMEPLHKQLYQSGSEARYALEVNQGWFETQDIRPGQGMKLIENTP